MRSTVLFGDAVTTYDANLRAGMLRPQGAIKVVVQGSDVGVLSRGEAERRECSLEHGPFVRNGAQDAPLSVSKEEAKRRHPGE